MRVIYYVVRMTIVYQYNDRKDELFQAILEKGDVFRSEEVIAAVSTHSASDVVDGEV